MDIPDLTPLQWALVVVLLLLAMVGIGTSALGSLDTRCCPCTQPSACGGPPHQLAYITEKERFDLIEAGGLEAQPGTDGVPATQCKRGRIQHRLGRHAAAKRQKTAPSIEPSETAAQANLLTF